MKKKKLLVLPAVGLMTSLFTIQASAFSLLPQNIKDIFDLMGEDGTGAAGFVTSKVSTALYFTLGILVLFGIIYAIIAAFKYIRSEGDPGQIEEAQKGIKAIFYGILAMMLGIVGIVLLFVFMGASQPNAELTQVCLSAPGSVGCASCKQGDDAEKITNYCGLCENYYKDLASPGTGVTNLPNAAQAKACKDPLDQGMQVTDPLPTP